MAKGPAPPLFFLASPVTSQAQKTWRDSLRALRHRDFRLYFAGMVVSLAGSYIQNVAQSWLMYRLTRSELMLGLTVFCGYFPTLLLGPVAGVAADHYSRRRLVMTAQALQMFQALVLAWLTIASKITPAGILLMASLFGVINAFDVTARQSLFMELVGREDLLSAISLNSTAFNLARVAGPPAGGVLVAAIGEGGCFLVNGLSFLAILFALAAMRSAARPSGAGARLAESIAGGFRYVQSRPHLATLLTTAGMNSFAMTPVVVMAPFFADGIFGKGSQGFGLLNGAMGAGAVVGVLALARHRELVRLPGVVSFSLVLMLSALALFSLSTSYWFCLALMVMVGFASMRLNTANNTMIQLTISEQYRGRVTAFYAMMVHGMLPLGSFLSGLLGELAGPRLTVFSGATVCLLSALIYWRRLAAVEGAVRKAQVTGVAT